MVDVESESSEELQLFTTLEMFSDCICGKGSSCFCCLCHFKSSAVVVPVSGVVGSAIGWSLNEEPG